jgi:acyl-coenzyme A synthetase/AMP-(fatty) acid ligase
MNFLGEIIKYTDSPAPAIVDGESIYSYNRLIKNALGFADYLKTEKITSVIIKSKRSANAVIAALGVMFSGGVFAFLGGKTSDELVASAAEDLGAGLIIDDDIDFSVYGAARDFDCGGSEDFDCGAARNFSLSEIDYSAPVCAVFTSGSTGQPKGALLTYRGLCETVAWQSDYMKLPARSHTASYAEFGFIAAFWELWYPLANGFTLHIIDRKTRLDLDLLSRFIDDNEIAYVFLPSDVAEIFTGLYGGGALRFLRVAGGRLCSCGEPKDYEILYSLGMSENSGSVTFLPISTAKSHDIPIGKPFYETEIYLIDGEMAVSGPSLFAGYAGRPAETNKVLLDNPYSGGRADYAKMYISGDLAEIDNDGNFHHKGRRDWIVKIGNVKVNPLETERVILGIDGVFEAAVLPFFRDDGSAYLACFFCGDISENSLREQLSDKLSANDIPSYFVKLDSLPKNSNGKIDRSKLKVLQSDNSEISFITEREKTIAAAFEKVLGTGSGTIGADDGFTRLGGNSLGVMKLQAELITRGISLTFSDIFTAQTPRKIAAIHGSLQDDLHGEILHTKPEKNKAYPLTPPERQMWLLNRTGQDNGRYTLNIRCEFDGEIDREKAENALQKLMMKNPILSSFYSEKNGEIFRFFGDISAAFSSEIKRDFDLEKGPLFGAFLNENSLVFYAHHIVADAAAMRVLMEDFWIFYSGEMPVKAAQFHDLELFEITRENGDDEAFWESELRGKTYPLLPRETPPNETKETVIFFDKHNTKKLKKIAADLDVTLFVMFAAAAAKLTSEIEKKADVCIGLPFSGRELPETIRTVGMLVRTLPLAVNVNEDFTAVIHSVNEHIKNAFLHQNYPFEKMNEKFGARYDVMVNYIPYPAKIKGASGLSPRIIRSGYSAPAAALVIDLREEIDGMSAVFTYDSYSGETVKNWTNAFRAILFFENYDEIISPKENADYLPADGGLCVPEFAEVWAEIVGEKHGNFYALGGTSLKAIQIEEAMLSRGLYVSAADILRLQDFSEISKAVIPADDIDWEAE